MKIKTIVENFSPEGYWIAAGFICIIKGLHVMHTRENWLRAAYYSYVMSDGVKTIKF